MRKLPTLVFLILWVAPLRVTSAQVPVALGTGDAFYPLWCDCGTLYELPSAVAAMLAGTLLWAGSTGGDTPAVAIQIRISSMLPVTTQRA